LQTLLDINFFRELTCGERPIDIEALLNERKVILFDLVEAKLGDEVTSAFGRLMTALIQAIAKRRGEQPHAKHTPIHLIVDECHNFLSPTVEEILVESRKFGLHLTMAQQNVGYGMSPGMQKVVTGMSNVNIAGRVKPDQYVRTARLFPIEPAGMEALAKDQRKGVFYMRGGHGDTFRFRARSDLIDRRHSISPEMWRVTVGKQVRAHYHSVDPHPEIEPNELSSTPPLKKRRLKLE
jgi:hypothetical protein